MRKAAGVGPCLVRRRVLSVVRDLARGDADAGREQQGVARQENPIRRPVSANGMSARINSALDPDSKVSGLCGLANSMCSDATGSALPAAHSGTAQP
jgi:hypothetical protein